MKPKRKVNWAELMALGFFFFSLCWLVHALADSWGTECHRFDREQL